MAARDLLTDAQIKNYVLPDGSTERELKDGGNLQLRVRRGAKGQTKTWEFQYKLNGKKETISLGSFPEVNLAEARRAADVHRPILATGKSPKAAMKEEAEVQHAKALATVHGDTPRTLSELFERWDESYLKSKHSDGGAYQPLVAVQRARRSSLTSEQPAEGIGTTPG